MDGGGRWKDDWRSGRREGPSAEAKPKSKPGKGNGLYIVQYLPPFTFLLQVFCARWRAVFATSCTTVASCLRSHRSFGTCETATELQKPKLRPNLFHRPRTPHRLTGQHLKRKHLASRKYWKTSWQCNRTSVEASSVSNRRSDSQRLPNHLPHQCMQSPPAPSPQRGYCQPTHCQASCQANGAQEGRGSRTEVPSRHHEL